MKKDETFALFSRALKIRAYCQRISQLSWEMAKISKRYPLKDVDDSDLLGIVRCYEDSLRTGIQLLRDVEESGVLDAE